MSKVHRFVTNDFTVRIAAVDTTHVVAEMQTIQNSYPLATLGMGRAMTGALLLASHLKEGQQVGLHFKGNGPLGSVFAEADYEGRVRSYCPQPHYLAPETKDALNLGKALGFGLLHVTRQQPFQRQPFNGTVEMESGEIGEDIAHYLHQSHQIRSLVSLGVYLDAYGRVKAAGGVLIEVMPGVEEEIVEAIQKNADTFKGNVSKMILDGARPIDLVAPYLQGLSHTQIPHEQEVQYFCPCTVDRVMRALGILGQTDLQEMIDSKQASKIQCQMCGRSYEVSTEELADLKEALRKNSMH
jgi:molecular chaperone Hsp33